MSGLSFPQLPADVLRTSHRRKLETGDVLFGEGAAAESLYFVENGCVRLVVHPVDGKQLVLYRTRDGELLAEDHLVRQRYAFTAIADKKTVVLSVDRQTLRDYVLNDKRALVDYLSNLGDRNQQLRQNFARLGLPKATDKVLHLLKSLSTDNEAIDLTGRAKTLASDLNLTHETMYRALRSLEEQGTIRREKGWVRVLRQE